MTTWILLLFMVSPDGEISGTALNTYSSEISCLNTVEFFEEVLPVDKVMVCEEHTLEEWEI